MQEPHIRIQEFRRELHNLFPKRSDVIMNLLDALTSHGHRCRSIIQLSNVNCFDRQYSSITDAIADGLPYADFTKIAKLIYDYVSKKSEANYYLFIVDCTPNPRPYARKLVDRHITHLPNPAPGNKPIVVGHQYSALAMLPNNPLEKAKHWVIPISTKRVESCKKGNEVGMEQIVENINTLDLEQELCLTVGDTLYGTEQCRISAGKQGNLVHIFRINSKRNLYYMPTPTESDASKKGRKTEFGNKMNLSDAKTHQPYDQYEEKTWVNSKGKEYSVQIKLWKDVLLRGSRKYHSSEYPMNLIQIVLLNDQKEEVYKRPLWLSVFGSRRNEIPIFDVYQSYNSRYDIEHFFRFSKQNLLLDGYQTSDVEHEELWWKFCILAYTQLYLGKDNIVNSVQPWERYLPAYKNTESEKKSTITPSQAQRGFADLLKIIGTPAKACVARGKTSGRKAGEAQVKRELMQIIFKSKKSIQKPVESIVTDSESTTDISNPERMISLINLVQATLKKFNISASEFTNLLLNST
jgi:DDE superfamily endonuclease